jgi:hypothetical protein
MLCVCVCVCMCGTCVYVMYLRCLHGLDLLSLACDGSSRGPLRAVTWDAVPWLHSLLHSNSLLRPLTRLFSVELVESFSLLPPLTVYLH